MCFIAKGLGGEVEVELQGSHSMLFWVLPGNFGSQS